MSMGMGVGSSFYRVHVGLDKPLLRGWVGFDVDGTLVSQDGPGFDRLIWGAPVPEMIELVRWYLENGYEVRIFTARVAPDRPESVVKQNRADIQEWTKKVFGKELEVTCSKSGSCVALYDDIAHGVLPGGVVETDLISDLRRENNTLRGILRKHDPEWDNLDVFDSEPAPSSKAEKTKAVRVTKIRTALESARLCIADQDDLERDLGDNDHDTRAEFARVLKLLDDALEDSKCLL